MLTLSMALITGPAARRYVAVMQQVLEHKIHQAIHWTPGNCNVRNIGPIFETFVSGKLNRDIFFPLKPRRSITASINAQFLEEKSS